MKKIVKVFVILLIILLALTVTVKAADQPCKITFSTTSKELKSGDKITLNVVMSNITSSGGIKYISGIIDLPTDVFDVKFDTTDKADAIIAQLLSGSELEGDVAMLYVGENDTSSSGNAWNAALYDEGSDTKGFIAFNATAQATTQTVAKIELVVKDNAPKTNATISLEDMTVYGDDENEVEIEDSASIEFKINGGATTQNPPSAADDDDDDDDYELIDDQEQNPSPKPSQQPEDDDTADTDAPNTGIEDYIPAMVIVIVIGTISYIKYKKYKEID